MTDFELENLIQKDRISPLPEAPDLKMTLSAVRMHAESREPGVELLEKPSWALIISATAVSASMATALIAIGFNPLLLAIPALQLMSLRSLINKEV